MLQNRFISIKVKFLVSLFIFVSLSAGISAMVAYRYITRIADAELVRKGSFLGSILQNQLSELLIVNDIASINHFLDNVKEGDSDIAYLIVINHQKKIVGHTFTSNNIPEYINLSYLDTPQKILKDKRNNQLIRQVSFPVWAGKLGHVIIGLDELNVHAKGNQLALRIIGALSLMLFPVAIAVILFSSLISKPIKKILSAFQDFTPGKPLPVVKISSNDEMRLLADGFQGMMYRITELLEKSRYTELKIIETEKLASVGILASGIAHEINNPVAGIQTCAFRLQKLSTGKEREYADLIMESARQIQTIVKNLLGYARQPEYNDTPINLVDVIEFSIKLVQFRIERKSVDLKFQVPAQKCIVNGIKSHLVQVIVNCLINAIDAVENNGTILVGICNQNNAFKISIEDNGIGFTPETLKKAFDPFFTTKGNNGTGLGLFVSYTIIQAHQGSIELIPLTRGVRLEIILPGNIKT